MDTKGGHTAGEKLGQFGHHPNPAIDFCVEVEELQGITFNIGIGFDQLTRQVINRFCDALDFRVGGDEHAVNAKRLLWECADKLHLTAHSQRQALLMALEALAEAVTEEVNRPGTNLASGNVLVRLTVARAAIARAKAHT